MLQAPPPGLIFAAALLATAGMALVWPSLFTQWGGFPLKGLVLPLLQLIMFVMGTRVSFDGLRQVLVRPGVIGFGLGVQYCVMPFVAVGLAAAFGLAPEVATGVLLVGAVCAGNSSNVMTFFAGGNMALSVAMTTMSTLLSPVVTPTVMRLLADREVPVEFGAMLTSIVRIVLVPVVGGLLFEQVLRRRQAMADRWLPRVVITATCLVNGIITANSREALLTMGATLVLVEVLHNFLGYLVGYAGARALGLDMRDAATMAMQVGIRNCGLATGLAFDVFKSSNAALASVVFGTVQNASGAMVASYFRRHIPPRVN